MRCLTCLAERADGVLVLHANGKEYFFCKDHLPATGKKCAICGNEIKFGEECCSPDLADGQATCWACWKAYYPGK